MFDPSELRTYELEIGLSELEWLDANAGLEQYVPATPRFEGHEYATIGVRYKGASTLRRCIDDDGKKICAKVSTKLKFNEYDEDLRFFGLKRINFHAMLDDPSLLRERVAYGLFRGFGVPTARVVHARLVVNGEPAGLFALVEQIDGRFTRSRYPADGEGNLYKEVWPVHLDENRYLSKLKTNEDGNPSATKMVAFATALAEAGDSGFASVIDDWIGRESLSRYLAVDRAIDNWDGITGLWCSPMGTCRNHNYYWYEETEADRVHLIPWDLDNTLPIRNLFEEDYGLPTWSEEPATCEPTLIWGKGRAPARCDDIVDKMVRLLWSDYVDASSELLDDLFTEERVGADIDVWRQQIASAVQWDPFGPTPEQWQSEVDELRDAVAVLRVRIADEIEG